MKITKFVSLLLSVIMLSCALTSCSALNIIKYNAKLYSDAHKWINEDFLKENMVYGAFYNNENGERVYDRISPKSRTFVIENDEQYNQVFKEKSLDVDFEKEFIILYVFSDTSPREYVLTGLKLNDKKLIIQIKLQFSLADDACMPTQRCLVLKMDKVEVENVEFEKIRR